jgi:hypothetical protein
MEQQMHEIVQEVFYDLQATCDVLDAETLADTIGDRMFDYSEEYRNTEYVKRRALVLKVARQYV